MKCLNIFLLSFRQSFCRNLIKVNKIDSRQKRAGMTEQKMLTKELLKQVRQIEIKTRGVVNDVFSGEYHSVFKGRGMEFSEVREYQPGDDVRSIDWNVTARFGHPFIKIFEEERELTVMLLVDLSGSLVFGTVEKQNNRLPPNSARYLLSLQ